MVIHFYKYQATGNDFVLIDNRIAKRAFSKYEIEKICDRRFGIGADGLILIEGAEEADFNMVYYNSDGSQSLCGNGCRSAVSFASSLGIINNSTSFLAFDGLHQASILEDNTIRLKMSDVSGIKKLNDAYFIDTGSPHYVRFVKNLEDLNVAEDGKKIRNSDMFKPGGTNANFVELLPDNTIAVRTYERGVENETLSCGTGVTAAALAASLMGFTSPIAVKVKGGNLAVAFKAGVPDTGLAAAGNISATFIDIFLIGPAKMVFEGKLEL
ncbi:MAG: diaminopimelate epimerase [Cyclobacteriaceae bacterium]|nr:diaminopimelate epimerase [Cyclobacteriaceae bacterium]